MIRRMLQVTATVLAALLYIAAAAVIVARLYRGEERAPARSTGLALAAAAVAVHGLVVLQTTWLGPGLNLGFFNALSLVAWLTALGLVASAIHWRLEHLGALLLPLAAVTVVLALAAPPEATIPRGAMLEAHILLSMTAYSVLLAAVLQAVALAILDYRLRHHRATGFVRMLPALRTMEKQLFALVTLGFIALTAALGSGFLFIETLLAGHMIHKTTLTLTAWLVFGGLLAGHSLYGWRGQTAVRWTFTGFGALALGYFGTKFVLELLLSR